MCLLKAPLSSPAVLVESQQPCPGKTDNPSMTLVLKEEQDGRCTLEVVLQKPKDKGAQSRPFPQCLKAERLSQAVRGGMWT